MSFQEKAITKRVCEILRNADLADKWGKSLRYLTVIQGERSNKHLHLHFAIGGLPSHVKFNQFNTLVTNAKLKVENIDSQHDVNLTYSGWMEYITKEVGTKDTDNVLWTLF